MNDIDGLVDYSLEDFDKDDCFDICDYDIDDVNYYVNHGYDIVELDLLDFVSKINDKSIKQESTRYEQLANILGVEIGEEFRLKFDSGGVSKVVYKIEEDDIYDSSPSVDNGQFLTSDIGVRTLMSCEIVKLPWKPKVGEYYYYIDQTSVEGWCELKYNNDNTDKRILSRSKEVYRTEEEAKEAVKKLGWVAE